MYDDSVMTAAAKHDELVCIFPHPLSHRKTLRARLSHIASCFKISHVVTAWIHLNRSNDATCLSPLKNHFSVLLCFCPHQTNHRRVQEATPDRCSAETPVHSVGGWRLGAGGTAVTRLPPTRLYVGGETVCGLHGRNTNSVVA